MESFAPAFIVAAAMMLPIVFLIVRATRNLRERELEHKERMRALELGIELPAEAFQKKNGGNGKNGGGGKSNAGLHGVIWTGIGAGLMISRGILGEIHGVNEELLTFTTFLMIWGVPAFFVGLGLIGYSLMGRFRSDSDGEA